MGKPGTASPQQRGALSLAVHFFQPHQPVVEQSITILVPTPAITIRPRPTRPLHLAASSPTRSIAPLTYPS